MSEEKNIERQGIENEKSKSENVNQHFPEDSHAPQLQTSNIQLQTTNMEVHKHPHHVTHKKKWGEYLLEFFMLFLAVFLGFVAENIREGSVERRRAKEYMHEIVDNLKYDTIRCSLNSSKNIQTIAGLDSFRMELKNAIAGNINANSLYYFDHYTSEINHAVFNKSAITELKNSGSLRLLENKTIVSELSDYYERKVTATEAYLPSKTPLAVYETEFFSLLYLDDLVKANDIINPATYHVAYNYQDMLYHKPSLHLLEINTMQMERFYTAVSNLEIQIKNYNFWLLYSKTAAEKLINDIQKAYHLQK